MSQTMSPQCASIYVLGGVKKRFIPFFGVVTSGTKSKFWAMGKGPPNVPPSLLLSFRSTSNVISLFSTRPFPTFLHFTHLSIVAHSVSHGPLTSLVNNSLGTSKQSIGLWMSTVNFKLISLSCGLWMIIVVYF